MLLLNKYGQRELSHRQAERFASEGMPFGISALADRISLTWAALMPIFRLSERHALVAEPIHGDDTTVPVCANGKTITGRLRN